MATASVMPHETGPVQNGVCWYATYTCSRHEKTVAQYLKDKQIETFLPLYRSWRRWKDRRKAIDLALFPSYLFVRIPAQDRIKVLQVPGVVHLVGFQGQLSAVPEHEIDALRQALANEIYVEPHPYLRMGQRVRVVRGPLMGMEGILSRKDDRSRIVISIEAIMRSIAVEVDITDVKSC
jgi:transcription antitermination factor NusG